MPYVFEDEQPQAAAPSYVFEDEEAPSFSMPPEARAALGLHEDPVSNAYAQSLKDNLADIKNRPSSISQEEIEKSVPEGSFLQTPKRMALGAIGGISDLAQDALAAASAPFNALPAAATEAAKQLGSGAPERAGEDMNALLSVLPMAAPIDGGGHGFEDTATRKSEPVPPIEPQETAPKYEFEPEGQAATQESTPATYEPDYHFDTDTYGVKNAGTDEFVKTGFDTEEEAQAHSDRLNNPGETEMEPFQTEMQSAPVGTEQPETPVNASPETEFGNARPEFGLQKQINDAAAQVDISPTPAQIEAGNYKKGHVNIQGLDVTIENPRGSIRSGVDADGKPWNVTMPNHYGYIKNTKGMDGEHVDAYIGNNPGSDTAFIVDQIDADTGKPDEHKVMLGYNDMDQATTQYEKAFSDGRGSQRIGSVTPVSIDNLKEWLKTNATKKPAAESLPTEKTPSGQQSVIPGAERISDRALAERNMQKPLRSDATQKPDIGGMFDTDARKQGDLLDMPPVKEVKTPAIKPNVIPPSEIGKPTSLKTFLTNNGGKLNESGELQSIKNGKTLLKGDDALDHAGLIATNHGYFDDRPRINDLQNTLRDTDGGKQHFRQKDTDRVLGAQEKSRLAIQSDPSRIEHDAANMGIDTAGKTTNELLDAIADHMSFEERAREIASQNDAAHAQLAEHERQHKEWLASRGESWEPEEKQSRTLEDLENERRQEEVTGNMEQGAQPRQDSEPASGNKSGIQESSEARAHSPETDGRAGAGEGQEIANLDLRLELPESKFPNSNSFDNLFSTFRAKDANPKSNDFAKLMRNIFSNESGAVPMNAPKSVRDLISPTMASESAAETGRMIRRATGDAERQRAIDEAALNKHARQSSALTKDPEGLRDFYNYIEGRSEGATLKNPELHGFADAIRQVYGRTRARIEAMPLTRRMNFVRDYFPHMWENEAAAAKFSNDFIARQGSDKNLKKRAIPTIQDGLDAGLKLKEPNPVRATSRYLGSMNNFIASVNILRSVTQDLGGKYYAKGMQPEGFEPLVGKNAERIQDAKIDEQSGKLIPAKNMQLYAPPDVARIFNRFYSKGFEDTGGKTAYELARSAVNANTMLELGMSGYHFGTITIQSINQDIGRLAKNSLMGDWKGAADAIKNLTVNRIPFSPGGHLKAGTAISEQYLQLKNHGIDLEQIADHYAKANLRVGQDPLSTMSHKGFYDSYMRGELPEKIEQLKEQAKSGYGFGLLKSGAEVTGKVISDFSHPLFNHYIPAIKLSSFADLMGDWLRQHPKASDAEIAVARVRIGNLIEDRFGEMNMDNIFWSKWAKQLTGLNLRAPGWDLGLVRQTAGAGKDIYSMLSDAATGKKFNSDLLDRPLYMLGAVGLFAALNSAMTYFKTGKAPDNNDLRDFIAYKTGGLKKTFGKWKPERGVLPGHSRELVNMYPKPGESAMSGLTEEIKNKIATLPKNLWDISTNKDWKGKSIYDPKSNDWAKNTQGIAQATYLAKGFVPFSWDNMANPQPGSNLNILERALGVKQAGARIIDRKDLGEYLQKKERDQH